MYRSQFLILTLLAAMSISILPSIANSEDSPAADQAPKVPMDKIVKISSAEQNKKLDAAMEPVIAKARQTLPQAKQRFLNGLPSGYLMFVTTPIYDSQHRFEQVFVRVLAWKDQQITGLLASNVEVVKEHHTGEQMSVKEPDVVDWTIVAPDGTEEGNIVGKFIGSYSH
jgi:uncharacterized protein YegJ (DUF2314 family)